MTALRLPRQARQPAQGPGWLTDKVLRAKVREALRGDDLAGLLRLVRADDHDTLAVQQEGIHVGDADTGVAECLDGVRRTAGTVVHFDGEHLREGDGHAGLLEGGAGAVGLAADNPENAVFGRLRNRAGDHLDTGPLQYFQHLDQGAGLVLDEDGELLDSHIRTCLGVNRVYVCR